jgi:glutamate N-acetyltransferase/amino-acid N-acetyltransferase
VAAVFTKNCVQAAPVKLDRERVKSGMTQAVIVNAGNANCANGQQGLAAAGAMAAAAARALNLPENQVLVASTGVIGAPFPIEAVEAAVPALADRLNENGIARSGSCHHDDRHPTQNSRREGSAGGRTYRIAAVAKGAGMIRPDMATMLCFVITDADMAISDLQTALGLSVEGSFNRITIDGDTSTNDTVILMANGAAGGRIESDEDRATFQRLLDDLCRDLARQMVKDGEGVTKVVDLTVRGARSDPDARAIADTIAHSPLVKTAFFGEDANWGRIIAAAGRAGAVLDPGAAGSLFRRCADGEKRHGLRPGR